MHVDDAIRERRSIRAFKSDPVPRALLEDLLEIASRAPSGTNVQPWHVHVVMDAARDRLVDRVMTYRDAHRAELCRASPLGARYDGTPSISRTGSCDGSTSSSAARPARGLVGRP